MWKRLPFRGAFGAFGFEPPSFPIHARTALSEAVVKRMEELSKRHDQVMEKLNSGDSSVGKELSIVAPVARLKEKLDNLNEEEAALMALMEEADGDKEMQDTCRSEMDDLQKIREKLERRAVDSVIPKDPDDGEDAILEIRAGTGGSEASLFSFELLEAYSKTAKAKGFQFEVMSISKTTDLGGIKDAIVEISQKGGGYGYSQDDDDDDDDDDVLAGLGPYGFFKMESGVHRVQRIPVNDVKLQTSACSVAVFAAPSESSDERNSIPSSELRIETMRSSGAGGQHVNTTDSAVRITHIPTGITASIQDERSQHKNKAKALKLIAARVREAEQRQRSKERGEERTALMGGGDRSERIRTYNFPQDRVTDHRTKQSEFNISKLMMGGEEGGLVSVFAPPLRAMQREQLIEAIGQ